MRNSRGSGQLLSERLCPQCTSAIECPPHVSVLWLESSPRPALDVRPRFHDASYMNKGKLTGISYRNLEIS